MSNLLYTTDLKADALFRSGEPTDGTSDFDAKALEYLNRAQMTLALGGGEFNEDIQEDWWWLRKDPPGVLTLQPPYETGSVTVTNNNTAIVFSNPPTFSAAGYFFRTSEDGDIFRISAHTAADANATLDSVFTGTTGSKTFKLMKLEYDLATDVLRVIAPMKGYTCGYFEVDGVDLKSLERDYPIGVVEKGRPNKFAPIGERKVRFNRSGIDTDGSLIRLEYDYLFLPTDLTAATSEEPIVPRQYRRLLADMAVFWLLLDKDDNRDVKLAEVVKRGIRAMSFEHKHRVTAFSRDYGKIKPRANSNKGKGPLRTESGFIIG